MRFNVLGQTGVADEEEISYQLTQNWYVHTEPEGKFNISLLTTPGETLFASVGDGPIRGTIDYGGLLYVVSGNKVYSVTNAGTVTQVGTSGADGGDLSTSDGRCILAHNGSNNGKEIAIADGAHFYVIEVDANRLKNITLSTSSYYDANCLAIGATHVIFMDGYFLVNVPSSSGRFQKSASYNGENNWDSTELATAEQASDELKAIISSNSQIIYLVGEISTEAWVASGASDFPFEPAQAGYMPYGTVAPYSVEELDGTVFWLSKSKSGQGIVVMVNGYSISTVSLPAIASEINDLGTLTDAYAWTYQYKQHAFYVLTFPTGNKTFVYDITTKKWFVWSSEGLGYHRSSFHTFIYGKHIVSDPLGNKLYYLDWDNYTDNGDTITRIRRSVNIHSEDRAVRHYALHIEAKEGVGNATIEDPQIMMRYRDNNGAWSHEKKRSLGKIGERGRKIIWRQLGRSRNRVYELKVTDPCNAALFDGYLRTSEDSREIG